jgi:hypothetical protein
MPKTLTLPVPEFSVYRYMPSELTVISRFVLPLGFVPTTVPDTGVNAPAELIANPEIVDDAEFDV